MKASELRTAFWHLRHGGLSQLGRYLDLLEKNRREVSEAPEDIVARREEELDRLRGFNPLDFPALGPNPNRKRPFEHYRVGVIMDEFSLLAWGEEFELVVLSREGWREQIDSGIDFLFVESAWHGNYGQWRYQVVGTEAPTPELRDLATYCRNKDIPSVFWNKEDPAHFEDFVDSARLFDYIATTDGNCIERYREIFDPQRVFVLPFAAQPAIHNPIRNEIAARRNRGDIAFAGTYFRHKFTQRREQMEKILNAGIDASAALHSALTIYSRNEDVDEKYQFPEPFSEWVVGSLPYERMVSAYRGYKVFLNVNTITDSPTMFSRRVFELLACGTAVVSSPALGLDSFFSERQVPRLQEDSEGAAGQIEALVRSDFSRDRIVHRAQREIWSFHTYTHRAADLLKRLGFEHSTPICGIPRVAVIMSTNRPNYVEQAIARVLKQKGVEVHLYVATHGFGLPENLIGPVDNLTVIEKPATATLGECLNSLIDLVEKSNTAANSPAGYVAKMDDDDHYGEYYLLDQVNALRYSGATVVGKQASYLYLETTDELVLRKTLREHMFTDLVAGATLVMPMWVASKYRFAEIVRGEDTDLLRRIRDDGGTIYSSDRFNFIQRRSTDGHTWDVDDIALLRSGYTVTRGYNTSHVDVGGSVTDMSGEESYKFRARA